MAAGIYDLESVGDKQVVKLDNIIAQKVKLSQAEQELQERTKQYKSACFDAEASCNQLARLEIAYAESKVTYEQEAARLRALEEKVNTLTLQSEQSKLTSDLIEARKAELELLQIKPAVLHLEIMMLEQDLGMDKVRKAVTADEATADAAKQVKENASLRKKQLMDQIELRTAELENELAEIMGKGQNNIEQERLATELDLAKATISKQNEEIEALKHANEEGQKGTILNIDALTIADTTTGPSPSADANAALIQDLKDTIEQMRPLYNIGCLIRIRKLANDNRKVPLQREMVVASGRAAHNGQAVADATMFAGFSDLRRGVPSQFEEAYGVDPTFLWNNRDFTMFVSLVNWKSDMKKNRPANQASFDSGYHKIISKIYPKRTIQNDAELKDDEELHRFYKELETMYQEAEEAARASRRMNGY